MTVSIHATSGWALAISPHQSMALPTQPRRQRGRAGENDSFPSLPLSLSSPLFLPICVSHSNSNSSFVNAAFPHRALTQPVTFSLASFFSAPLCVSFPSERDKWVSSSCVCPSLSSVCLSLPPCCLSACRHTHTDDQQTLPAQRGPRAASFPPKSRQSALNHLLACYPNFPSWPSVIFVSPPTIYSIIFI